MAREFRRSGPPQGCLGRAEHLQDGWEDGRGREVTWRRRQVRAGSPVSPARDAGGGLCPQWGPGTGKCCGTPRRGTRGLSIPERVPAKADGTAPALSRFGVSVLPGSGLSAVARVFATWFV